MRYLKSFIEQESLHLDVLEHSLRCRELFGTAVTREARQQQLEKFFKAAFARVSNDDDGGNDDGDNDVDDNNDDDDDNDDFYLLGI